MKTAPGSFRDPGGQVYKTEDGVYRTINQSFREQWEKIEPFLLSAAKDGLVVPFEEVEPFAGSWKTLKLDQVPFISYPYEWSHDQLRDAALLTLKLQKRALRQGLILKDASAYNIQFVGAKPIFIDHLSFEQWEEGKPWNAYKQFCSHFVAPLALSSSVDLRCGLLSKLWIDGIPLDIAAAMMPFRKRLNSALYFHLFLHAKMQNKYANPEQHTKKVSSINVTADYLIKLAESLERLLQSSSMQLPKTSTEWGDYYNNTNYTVDAANEKEAIVADAARRYGNGGMALDLGANTGRYTVQIAPHFSCVVAADIDPLAVDAHYMALKTSKTHKNILPLIVDFSNPSSAIGFNNTERPGFIQRCNADFIIALALIHHLRITAGIPLEMIAEFFSLLMNKDGILVLEFVPKEDSQTQKLLALREDVFADYDLESCKQIFSEHFNCLSDTAIMESSRNMLVLQKK